MKPAQKQLFDFILKIDQKNKLRPICSTDFVYVKEAIM